MKNGQEPAKKTNYCEYCGGNGNLLGDTEDFCPKCGEPSPSYRDFVYEEEMSDGCSDIM